MTAYSTEGDCVGRGGVIETRSGHHPSQLSVVPLSGMVVERCIKESLQVGQECRRSSQDLRHVPWKMWPHGNFFAVAVICIKQIAQLSL